MTEAEVEPLVELANARSDELVDRWGRTSLIVGPPFDFAVLEEFATRPGYTVVGYFGGNRIALKLEDTTPSSSAVSELARLATSESEAARVTHATSAFAVAEVLVGSLVDVDIHFDRRGWARTERALLDAIASRWTDVARDMPIGHIGVEGAAVQLERVAAWDPAKPEVWLPQGDRPDGEAGSLWDAACRVADAAAWVNIAVTVDSATGSRVALHSDQDVSVDISAENATGGVALLRWWDRGTDGNREEALRHVLRFATAAAPDVLPSARIVQRLAERQRIALSRDRAAEVFRAIADSNRSASELLDNVGRSMGDLVEDTTKNTNAMIVASLGVVAIVAKDAGTLPDALIIAASVAAAAGIIGVVKSRWSRIADHEAATERLMRRLNDDPLLPASDLKWIRAAVDGFELTGRARQARAQIALFGSAAAIVVLAAAVWLVARGDGDATPASPGSTVTTTSSSLSQTTSSSSTTASPSTATTPQTPATSAP